uniref:Uncharacterized protein n=1 Tax=Glossina austeni TaxID=7395 RepID=A0A1A9VT53_GLOAU
MNKFHSSGKGDQKRREARASYSVSSRKNLLSSSGSFLSLFIPHQVNDGKPFTKKLKIDIYRYAISLLNIPKD